jgi:Ser/Thr protein kinase RdoA (MazF antagonist)
MDQPDYRHALEALDRIALSLGLASQESIVLHDSNRLAVHVLPGNVLARVAPAHYQVSADFELKVALEAAKTGSPAERPAPGIEPRVFLDGGFAVTFWTYYQPEPAALTPQEYARALEQFHAGMRNATLPAPHFTSRFDEAVRLTSDPELSPELSHADRAFLLQALAESNLAIARHGAPEQPIHGEPHPGNVLNTRLGPVLIDLETCVVGPVEFDLATAPPEVAAHYTGLDPSLLHDCRRLTRALVAAWRWDRDDRFPGGRQLGESLIAEMRADADHA